MPTVSGPKRIRPRRRRRRLPCWTARKNAANPPERGEVWLADLGFAAKVRPVLVVSVPFADSDYALIQSVPHTTQPRGAQFEVRLLVRFLQDGAFNIQGMLAVPSAKFLRRLGMLAPAEMSEVEVMIKRWMGLVG
ncbi:MAG: type II toxin-antitoxin system PemK/MazF family toxin [Verrucomicrobia bacterium]|nr:type II toxin-antitoxin system PemK/MazF family toxin [Verrucomicrobiota bacterium]